MTQGLVDFHCHLDLYPDFESLVAECDTHGIHTVAVTTTPRAWLKNHELAARTKHVHAALGIHPQIVGTHGHEIDLWESLLPRARYVGEVGLDAGPRYFRTLELQKKVFERVLQACNREGAKILSVHSIRSTALVLDMIETYIDPGKVRLVLHWFTGSTSEARRATQLGCYFSINEQMATSPRSSKVVACLPDDRLLTETDGPFASTQGKPSRPIDAANSVKAIAAARQASSAQIKAIVAKNFATITSEFSA